MKSVNAIAATFLFAIFVACGSSPDGGQTTAPQTTQSQARDDQPQTRDNMSISEEVNYRVAAEKSVKEFLQYPNDAKFDPGMLSQSTVTKSGDAVQVIGQVLAKNGFGAELTHDYRVTFEDDIVTTVSLNGEYVYVDPDLRASLEQEAEALRKEQQEEADRQARMSHAAGKQATLKPMREWTDASGSFKVTARLSGRMDDSVRLVKEDGESITVPIEKLSDVDREYLDEQ